MRSKTTPLLAVGASVVVLATGTACGGEGDLSEEPGAAGDGDLRPITVLETVGMPEAFLSYGVEEGHFEEEGLAVELESSGGGTVVVPPLMNGEADVAGTSTAAAMLAMEQGLSLRMIAAGTSTSEDPEEDFSAVLTSEDSSIEDVADLADAQVAINALQNISDATVHGLLSEQGLDSGDVEFVEMPFPDMVPAVQRGDVDAAVLIEPFVTIGLAEGLQEVARPFSELNPGQQIGTFLMMSERIEEDPELAEAFREGVRRTADSIEDDPDAFREALPDLGEFTPELAGDMELPRWRVENDPESLQVMAEVMLDRGLLEEEVDTDEVIWE